MQKALFLLSILLVSCVKHNPEELKFEQDFLSKVDSLKLYTTINDISISAADNRFWALGTYFLVITDHIPTVDLQGGYNDKLEYVDSVYYQIKDYKNDIKIWKKWLKKNKDKYSFEFADSLYKDHYYRFSLIPKRVW